MCTATCKIGQILHIFKKKIILMSNFTYSYTHQIFLLNDIHATNIYIYISIYIYIIYIYIYISNGIYFIFKKTCILFKKNIFYRLRCRLHIYIYIYIYDIGLLFIPGFMRRLTVNIATLSIKCTVNTDTLHLQLLMIND